MRRVPGVAWRHLHQLWPQISSGRLRHGSCTLVTAATAQEAAVARDAAVKTLLLVESPAKAKKIQSFLGIENYKVLASYGHVRDLSEKQGSVVPEEGFRMKWQQTANSHLQDIVDELWRGYGKVILAMDPDREGEAISWHILEELQTRQLVQDVEVERITFTEVTKRAVLDALSSPRTLSQPLVDAYLARRALDYLVGYHLSPVLWRKLPGARSAGRVQSVALKLVSKREAEIEQFSTQPYWSLEVEMGVAGHTVPARVTHVRGQRIQKPGILDPELVEQAVLQLQGASLVVSRGSTGTKRRNPVPPFTTSTMVTTANSRLGWSAKRTMAAAQKLYEGLDRENGNGGEGLITYMRTDGVSISSQALEEIRTAIGRQYGPGYVPDQPRFYKSRSKNAQEAHEAIRPVNVKRLPLQLPRSLPADLRQLYELIWTRTVASQMNPSEAEEARVWLHSEDKQLQLIASCSRELFDGYLRVWREGVSGRGSEGGDEEESARDGDGIGGHHGVAEVESGEGNGDEGGSRVRVLSPEQRDALVKTLQALTEDDRAVVQEVLKHTHETKPPGLFTEGSLVQEMERNGIGRPSTYAPTLQLLQDRGYLVKEGRSLKPSSLGRVLSTFLESYFARYVDLEFTADLEQKLDEISAGRLHHLNLLQEFWHPFKERTDSILDVQVRDVIDVLDMALGQHLFPPSEDGTDPRACPSCGTGRLGLKLSRKGGFIGCSNFHNGCGYARPLGVVRPGEDGQQGDLLMNGMRVLGVEPQSGLEVTVRSGLHGLYLRLGEPHDELSRTMSLPRGTKADTISLEEAGQLLTAFPQHLGHHPVTGLPVELAAGRFGPFVRHGNLNAALPKKVAVGEVDLEKALEILQAKAKRKKSDEVELALQSKKQNGRKKKARAPAKKASKTSAAAQQPSAPKRGPTAYTLFLREVRPDVKKNNPDAAFGDLSKLVGQRWRELSDQQRAPYELTALKLAEEGLGSDVGAETPRSTSPPGVAIAKSTGASAQPPGGRKRGRPRKERPPTDNSVLKERRPAVKDANPEAAFVAQQWQELKEEGQAIYEQRPQQLALAARGVDADAESRRSTSSGSDTDAASTTSTAARAQPRQTQKQDLPRKRTPSAYSLFLKKTQPEVRQANPDAAFGEVSRQVGQRWRELSEEERAPYKRQAQQLARVARGDDAGAEPPRPDTDGGNDTDAASSTSKASSTQPRRAQAREQSPKRTPTPYNLFLKQTHPEIKEANPDASFGDVSKLVGERWKQLSGEERATYERQAQQLAQDARNADVGAEKACTTDGGNGAASTPSTASSSTPRKAQQRKALPKRTPNAYVVFVKEVRPQVREANPDAVFGEVSRLVGRRWQQLSEEERLVYKQKAESLAETGVPAAFG